MRPDEWPDVEPDICPGYLISLPAVIETALAYRWWDKGQLLVRLDGLAPTAALIFYLDVYASALNQAEAHSMRGIGDKRRG